MAPLIAAALGMGATAIRVFAGEKAGALAEAAADAIAGTNDPDAIRKLPPEQQAELRKEMGRIQLEALRLENEDRQRASDMAIKSNLVAMTQVRHSYLSIGVVAFLVLASAVMSFTGIGEGTFLQRIMDGATGLFTAIVMMQQQFFFGNSTSAHAANQRSDRLAEKATEMLPAPAILAADPTRPTDDLNAASLARARGNAR